MKISFHVTISLHLDLMINIPYFYKDDYLV